MKVLKNIILFVAIILLFVLFLVHFLDLDKIMNSGAVEQNVIMLDPNKSGLKESYTLKSIEYSEYATQTDLNDSEIQRVLYSLPDAIYQRVFSDGWTFQVETPENMRLIAKRNGYNVDLNGLTVYKAKQVYIASTDGDTVLHEVGHVLDYALKGASDDSAFKSAYKLEKQIFAETYNSIEENIATESEYFAESFAKYMSDEQTLKANCPRTYKYVNNLIQNL